MGEFAQLRLERIEKAAKAPDVFTKSRRETELWGDFIIGFS